MSIRLINKNSTRTTRGVLSKAWYMLDSEKVLVKGNTENGYEPYSEAMAWRIGKVLGIPNMLSYWLMPSFLFPEVKVHNIEHVSVCRNFCSDGEDFISLYNYVARLGPTDKVDWFKVASSLFGDSYLADMLFLDAVTGNDDRHFNNFGIIISKNDRKPSPIFDCGASLLGCIDDTKIPIHCQRYRYDAAKPFRTTHVKQSKLLTRSTQHVATLEEIMSAVAPVLKLLPAKRADAVAQFLRWRCDVYVPKTNV